MKEAVAAWMWSLSVLGRSIWTLLALAAEIALWAFAAYEWLGLPESSALLLVFALMWAVLQALVTVGIIAGCVSRIIELTAAEGGSLPVGSLWPKNRKSLLRTLLWALASSFLALLLLQAFNWINNHSVEVASFLTFHSQKPVSHVLLEQMVGVIESLLWIALSGFLLSFLIVLMRGGWRAALQQARKLLAGCTFQTPFLTSLLSVGVFGGIAYSLSIWHPVMPVGSWDYTQVVVRFSLVLVLLAAGWMFWLLSLARLYIPRAEASVSPETIPAFLP